MLLYSTTLRIKDTLTKDGFVQLVIQWNQSSPHADNVIPDVRRTCKIKSEFHTKFNTCKVL